MNAESPRRRPLALEPIEVSTPGADAAKAMGDGFSAGVPVRGEFRITSADEFLARATKEYQEGHIDQALWARASGQAGNDESLVIAAYLRARATALQLRKRDERPEGGSRRVGALPDASNRKVESEPHLAIVSTEIRSATPRLKYVAATAGALAVVGAFVWLVASPWESEPVRQPIVSTVANSAARSAPPAPSGRETIADNASGGMSHHGPDLTLETRVEQLKNAGNWNVLVLYASEWTRKEPSNAAAWNELSVGYAKLRQFDDALDAATKAVQLSPGNPLFWRNLGHLELTLERLPEAGIAFDRALAVSSDDEDARCGAALVAQRQGRPKDAAAIAKRVESVGGSCPGVSGASSAGVDAGSSGARKLTSPARR